MHLFWIFIGLKMMMMIADFFFTINIDDENGWRCFLLSYFLFYFMGFAVKIDEHVDDDDECWWIRRWKWWRKIILSFFN